MLLAVKTALASAFLSIALTVPALCQTLEQQTAACQDDAMRFCSAYVPDEPKIHACLLANRASLTPACRAMVSPARKKQKKFRKRG